MKCNACWKCVEEVYFITSCNHVFCKEDAVKHFSKDMSCPACEKPLSSRDIRQVELSKANIEEKTMCLCGFPPEVVLDAAQTALKFWDNQRQVEIKYQEYLHKETISKATQMEKSYSDKLNETKQKYQSIAEKLQQSEEQQEITKREFQTIQEKYSEKVRERNKLQELYNSLKRRYDQTRDSSSVGRAPSPGSVDLDPSVSPSFKENQENQPVSLFRKESRPSSNVLDFRLSKSPTSNKDGRTTTGLSSNLLSNKSNSSGVPARSPLFTITQSHNNIQRNGILGGNSTSINSNNNINSNRPSGATGFLFNRSEAQKLLYTPLKRSRPCSPKGGNNFQINPVLPSRRSPSPK